MTPRIVVGVDGSSGSRDALACALEEAHLRGAALHVVYAWRMPFALMLPEPTIAGFAPLSVEDLERLEVQLREQATQLAAGQIQEVLGNDPDVDVRSEVVEGDPAEVLVEAAQGADLLVVGSRGRGGFAGLLLGSVGQQTAQHAPCPVIVVPHNRGSEDGR